MSTYFQQHTCSGHKRCHELKFQSVVTPDRLLACLWGPMNGNRHDSRMLQESKLLVQLEHKCLKMELYIPYMVILHTHNSSIFLLDVPSQVLALLKLNGIVQCLKVREVVDCGFEDIVNQWRFLHFHSSIKFLNFHFEYIIS